MALSAFDNQLPPVFHHQLAADEKPDTRACLTLCTLGRSHRIVSQLLQTLLADAYARVGHFDPQLVAIVDAPHLNGASLRSELDGIGEQILEDDIDDTLLAEAHARFGDIIFDVQLLVFQLFKCNAIPLSIKSDRLNSSDGTASLPISPLIQCKML